MYMICWSDDKVFENTWEIVSGEDAMQCRVGELMDELGCDADDIMVFDMESKL